MTHEEDVDDREAQEGLEVASHAETLMPGQPDSLAAPIGRLDPLGKQLVKRSLFPGRGRPVQIGRFTVLGMLGRGGMGVVYACYDDLLARKVAVKVIDSDVSGSASARVRLQREAQALARLNHPNVVSIHDVGAIGDRVYLAMELVEGQTLGAWLKASPRRWREVLKVILAAGDGLAAAHEKGLVHRDVKPENIMVGADGRVRVMDFGLARSGDEPAEPMRERGGDDDRAPDMLSSDLTRTGAVLGTPAFMAPEQFLGLVADARCDQFSLCATAWEALFGQPAFKGRSFAELAANVTAGVLVPPPEGSRVPAWLRRVLERGLRPRPADRYPDLPALLQALRADPTRRRWIAGSLAGAVSVALGVVAGERVIEARAIAACAAAASAVSEDWDEAARADLERAFLATGKPYAAATFERTIPWLDRWATAWQTAAFSACRAHTIVETWDAASYVRAGDCLGEARGQFSALIRELRQIDGAGLALATSAAAGLASVDRCAQAATQARRPTIDLQRWREAQALRARIARASSLEAAGRYKEGVVAAEAAEGAAIAAGAPVMVAQAALRLGSVRERAGDYGRSEASLRRALAAAREAPAPELALVAAIELAFVVGYREARPAEGDVWAEAARTQLALLPGEHPLERADLDNNVGTIRYMAGDYAGAARLYTAALEARERSLGAEHPRVADSLNNLAGVRFAAGEYAESARLHGRALVMYEQLLGPDHPQVATSLSNFAMSMQATGQLDEATRVLARALAIREAALGPEHPQTAASLANLALILQERGADEEAALLYARARDLYARALGEDHPKVAECLHNLATVRFTRGEYGESAALLVRAIGLYERASADAGNLDLANSLAALGEVRSATGAHAEALALFSRARAMIERSAGADHPNMAIVLQGLGTALVGLGRTSEAVGPIEQALAIGAAFGANAAELAEPRFVLAQALASTDLPRARALAEQAREGLAGGGGGRREAQARVQARVDAWLAAHR